MFMTGLVLFLGFRTKDVELVPFWKRRYFFVGIPYLFWNFIYTILLLPTSSLPRLAKEFYSAIIHGDQAYLYYVLVTMQLYLIFPLLVLFLKKFKRYWKQIWLASFALQILITLFIKYWLPQLDTGSWPYLLSHYGDFVGTYQLYFITGGVASMNYEKITRFIQQHIGKIKLALLCVIPLIWGYYILDRFVLNLSDKAAKSVHQPLFVVYALLMIAFVLHQGRMWAKKRQANPQTLLNRWITLGAQLSFGVYLTQAIGMSIVSKWIVPYLMADKFLIVPLIPTLFVFAYGLSFAISFLCYKTPGLSYLIGRKTQRKKKLAEPAELNKIGGSAK